jgi:SNF2 family DNA or RNA helicase
VCELKSKLIWLVTGTPIQNRTKELETLFSIFGIGSISPSDIDETIKKLIFHRTKAAAGIQLPPLAEHKKAVLWANAVEQKLAVNIHKRLSFCNVIPTGAAANAADDDDPDADVDMGARGMRMRFMAKAKKICIYPPLLEKNYGYVDHDSKISIVVQTLGERINNGCGKIVFCNYYDEIDEFARRFLALGVSVAKFDGRVPRGKRDSLLSTQVTVLLAQIKMCREGLNLQDHYSEVYFPSPNFNPAIENQAIARCWRMGQKNPVHVFRFLMEEPTLIPTPTPTAVLDMDTDTDTDASDSESSEADTDASDSETDEEETDADTDAEKKPAYSMDTYSYNLQTKKRELIALMEEMAAK